MYWNLHYVMNVFNRLIVDTLNLIMSFEHFSLKLILSAGNQTLIIHVECTCLCVLLSGLSSNASGKGDLKEARHLGRIALGLNITGVVTTVLALAIALPIIFTGSYVCSDFRCGDTWCDYRDRCGRDLDSGQYYCS